MNITGNSTGSPASNRNGCIICEISCGSPLAGYDHCLFSGVESLRGDRFPVPNSTQTSTVVGGGVTTLPHHVADEAKLGACDCRKSHWTTARQSVHYHVMFSIVR